jgi:hypothetical protein
LVLAAVQMHPCQAVMPGPFAQILYYNLETGKPNLRRYLPSQFSGTFSKDAAKITPRVIAITG